MIVALRIGLMVVALALLTGAVYSAWRADIPAAVVYFALAAICGTFERIAEAGRDGTQNNE